MDEKCAFCGSTENLQEHHELYDPEMTTTICKDCHEEIHNHGTGKPQNHPSTSKRKKYADLKKECRAGMRLSVYSILLEMWIDDNKNETTISTEEFEKWTENYRERYKTSKEYLSEIYDMKVPKDEEIELGSKDFKKYPAPAVVKLVEELEMDLSEFPTLSVGDF